MDSRLRLVSAWTADHHGIVSTSTLDRFRVDKSLRQQWVRSSRIERVGNRAYSVPGAPPGWLRELEIGHADLDGAGLIGGRSASRLHGLDGFTDDDVEFIVQRSKRDRSSAATARSTSRPWRQGDIVIIEGMRVTSAARTILDSSIFGFSTTETENAIDSALRMRLLSEQRLRTRALAERSQGYNGNHILLDALIDSGGESRLERWLLALLRCAGIHRPMTQRVFRSGSRTVARVDAYFPGGIVVEVAGHGTHATRLQRQVDAQRHTELSLRGLTVLTFTYEDVTRRPDWVALQIGTALRNAAESEPLSA